MHKPSNSRRSPDSRPKFNFLRKSKSFIDSVFSASPSSPHSMLQTELSRKTIQSWRNFVATDAFREGIAHLRMYNAPKIGRTNDAEMLRNAGMWTAYHEALNDIEEVLCAIPVREQSAESPGLINTAEATEE